MKSLKCENVRRRHRRISERHSVSVTGWKNGGEKKKKHFVVRFFFSFVFYLRLTNDLCQIPSAGITNVLMERESEKGGEGSDGGGVMVEEWWWRSDGGERDLVWEISRKGN